jgi:hypothetical protein
MSLSEKDPDTKSENTDTVPCCEHPPVSDSVSETTPDTEPCGEQHPVSDSVSETTPDSTDTEPCGEQNPVSLSVSEKTTDTEPCGEQHPVSISVSDKNTTPPEQQTQKHPNQDPLGLINAIVTDQNRALNILIGYIDVAQKRGAFKVNESSKIYECIKKFC